MYSILLLAAQPATAEWLMWGLIQYTIFVVSITFHEAAHAWAAWRQGDNTAYDSGQVTLNPWPHLQREPFGTMLLPLLTFLQFGGIMGFATAPYNPIWANRYPWRAFWMSMAGPGANLLLALASMIVLRLWLQFGNLDQNLLIESSQNLLLGPGFTPVERGFGLLYLFWSFNLFLGLFNLLPFPPLDGQAIWKMILPTSWYRTYSEFAYTPSMSILGIIVASALANTFLPTVMAYGIILLVTGL